MNKGNICILMLLVSLFFVSCVIDVSEVSQSESDGTENRDNIDNKGSVQNDKDDNQKNGDIKFDAGVGIQVEKPVIKLGQGDIEKLKIFIGYTNEYKYTFELIDDQYGRVVNEIRTYSPKNKDDEEGRGKNSAYLEIIKKGLTKFNENDLTNKFKKLEEIIKKSTDGVYNPKGLTTAVDNFKETVKKALSTNDAFDAREAADSYLNALHAAIIAYIGSFESVASTLSSSEFREAAQKLAEATRDFANAQDKIYAFKVITLAVSGLASEEGYMSMAKRLIQLIHRHETKEGQALLAAIDNLQSLLQG